MQKKPTSVLRDPTVDPVYLAADVVASLIHPLPAGTAYFIGVVVITMMTGRLVHFKGSLARAALPFVCQLKWGWHRVERAMERGKFSLDACFDRADTWCLANLPVEPVQVGVHKREVVAVDSSTIARWRATARTALLGKGYCYRAGRAVRANIVAAATRVVQLAGVRVGLVQRVRFGTSCQEAVAAVFADLPASAAPRLLAVDAGIATQEQFAEATERDALVGRLRINGKLRGDPPPSLPGKRGRRPKHGAILHPGAAQPEVAPDEDFTRPGEKGVVRVRRWNTFHFEEDHTTIVDVVRIDDPAYPRPLLIGSTATELTTAECEQAYGHRWPVETNFFVAQDTAAMEMPRAWTKQALERRIGFALLVGGVLKALAAGCEPLAMGPWDRKPERSAGRLANYLDLHAGKFAALSLRGVAPRNYRKIPKAPDIKDLPDKEAA
jgi:hypothetical protein